MIVIKKLLKPFQLFVFLFIFLFLILAVFDYVLAQEKTIEMNFFYSQTCPHCLEEKVFLNNLEKQYPELKINRFEISEKESVNQLMNFYRDFEVSPEYHGLVPILFFGKKYFVGFNQEIKKEIEKCLLELEKGEIEEVRQPEEKIIKLPFVGRINVADYSLPILAVILGFLDGFNVCSLGALVLILGLVLALKSRKKILIFGSIFIFTTAFVYGILIFLWYQIFSYFVRYLKFMEIIIGLLAIAGAVYFFKEFIRFRKYGPTCQMGGGQSLISRFSSNLQNNIRNSANILIIAFSVLFFAVVITIVEFPCSAAVPVIFAGVLAKADLSFFSYLFYISLFMIFYMLDEIIVFLIALGTMTIWLASPKLIIWITFSESIILFFLGFYYLFNFTTLF